MKVPIDDYACLTLDAPTLPAYDALVSGSVYWLVWCDHCSVSSFLKTGYNLALAGTWSAE
jgi:hypothetical protein